MSNKTNHFYNGPAKIVTTGAKVCTKIIQGLVKTAE